MIVRLVKLTIKPGMTGAFLDHFNSVSRMIRSFPGCHHLELLACTADSNILFTYSLWETEEHLGDYTGSELFRETWSRVKPMFEQRAEAWSCEKQQIVTLQ
jgi:heme-degrading monooxygenase HmoA